MLSWGKRSSNVFYVKCTFHGICSGVLAEKALPPRTQPCWPCPLPRGRSTPIFSRSEPLCRPTHPADGSGCCPGWRPVGPSPPRPLPLGPQPSLHLLTSAPRPPRAPTSRLLHPEGPPALSLPVLPQPPTEPQTGDQPRGTPGQSGNRLSTVPWQSRRQEGEREGLATLAAAVPARTAFREGWWALLAAGR